MIDRGKENLGAKVFLEIYLLSPKRQRQSEVPKFKWLLHCLFFGEDCNLNVYPKHLDRWIESCKSRTPDRGKGKLILQEGILQVSVIKRSLHYPHSQ